MAYDLFEDLVWRDLWTEARQVVHMPECLDGLLINVRENLPADLLEKGGYMSG
jgi:hypothetical protein